MHKPAHFDNSPICFSVSNTWWTDRNFRINFFISSFTFHFESALLRILLPTNALLEQDLEPQSSFTAWTAPSFKSDILQKLVCFNLTSPESPSLLNPTSKKFGRYFQWEIESPWRMGSMKAFFPVKQVWIPSSHMVRWPSLKHTEPLSLFSNCSIYFKCECDRKCARATFARKLKVRFFFFQICQIINALCVCAWIPAGQQSSRELSPHRHTLLPENSCRGPGHSVQHSDCLCVCLSMKEKMQRKVAIFYTNILVKKTKTAGFILCNYRSSTTFWR